MKEVVRYRYARGRPLDSSTLSLWGREKRIDFGWPEGRGGADTMDFISPNWPTWNRPISDSEYGSDEDESEEDQSN